MCIIFSSICVQLHIFAIYFLFQCENVWQILNFTAQMVLYCTYSYESQQVINGFSTYRPQIHDILWIQLLFHSFLSSTVTKNMSHSHYQCGTKEDLDSQLPFSIGVCLEFLLTKKKYCILDDKWISYITIYTQYLGFHVLTSINISCTKEP